MRERTVSKEVKEVLRDSIIVLIVIYGNEMWTWNKIDVTMVCYDRWLVRRVVVARTIQ